MPNISLYNVKLGDFALKFKTVVERYVRKAILAM